MIFEQLTISHLTQLLHFERENKAWFESLIAPRGDDFYNQHAIALHINECLAGAKQGISYAGVLVHQGEIVARANLKDIDTKRRTCTVGYRVAQQHIGKGFASYCLGELINKAMVLYSVKSLHAQVLDNNLASKRY